MSEGHDQRFESVLREMLAELFKPKLGELQGLGQPQTTSAAPTAGVAGRVSPGIHSAEQESAAGIPQISREDAYKEREQRPLPWDRHSRPNFFTEGMQKGIEKPQREKLALLLSMRSGVQSAGLNPLLAEVPAEQLPPLLERAVTGNSLGEFGWSDLAACFQKRPALLGKPLAVASTPVCGICSAT